jgi:outer membrane immunogenic protein
MRRDFLVGIGLLASVAASAGPAVAADIAARPAAQPPVVAPVYVPDWVGFYVGINGGGGWGHTSYDPSYSDTVGVMTVPLVVPPGLNSSGGVFGFQFGHNWQWGPVVGGLEIDFDGANIKESSTFFSPLFFPGVAFTNSAKIDELASARGRVGYLIFPNWLLYGTAGIGWGHSRYTLTASAPGEFFSDTSDVNQFGWVAGVGLEWKFWDHWLLRGEWLHYDFGRVTLPNNNFIFLETFIDTGNVRTTVDVARAALSYKF